MGKTQISAKPGSSSARAKKITTREMVGEYEIQGKPLAAGGTATLYRVTNPKGKEFIAKVLQSQFQKERKKRERFLHELQCLKRFRDTRIVKAIDSIEEKETTAIILEYLDGYDLAKMLKKGPPIPVPAVLHFIRELCLALKTCHKKGIFHRDLKPENIMITREGKLKLLDFGVVRDMDLKRTLPGTVLGTVDYMAPEQIEGSWDEVDHRVDLYAMGVMCYEMLQGKIPIRFSSKDSIIQILDKKKQKLPKKGKIEDRVLEELCLILIHPDPDHRPQKVEEIIDFLKRYKVFGQREEAALQWVGDCLNSLEKKGKASQPVSKVKPEKEAAKKEDSDRIFWLALVCLGLCSAFVLFYRFLGKFYF